MERHPLLQILRICIAQRFERPACVRIPPTSNTPYLILATRLILAAFNGVFLESKSIYEVNEEIYRARTRISTFQEYPHDSRNACKTSQAKYQAAKTNAAFLFCETESNKENILFGGPIAYENLKFTCKVYVYITVTRVHIYINNNKF